MVCVNNNGNDMQIPVSSSASVEQNYVVESRGKAVEIVKGDTLWGVSTRYGVIYTTHFGQFLTLVFFSLWRLSQALLVCGNGNGNGAGINPGN